MCLDVQRIQYDGAEKSDKTVKNIKLWGTSLLVANVYLQCASVYKISISALNLFKMLRTFEYCLSTLGISRTSLVDAVQVGNDFALSLQVLSSLGHTTHSPATNQPTKLNFEAPGLDLEQVASRSLDPLIALAVDGWSPGRSNGLRSNRIVRERSAGRSIQRNDARLMTFEQARGCLLGRQPAGVER